MSTLHFQSHRLLRGFFVLCLDDSVHRAIDLGKPGLVVENYRNPSVFTEWWKSHEQYLLHVSWKPFPESSAHQFLSSLLSTFNNCFYSTAISWYMLYRKDWGRQVCSSQYNPSFPRKGDTLNLDFQVYDGCLEVNSLQMAAMHWRKDKKVLVRYGLNCAFGYRRNTVYRNSI